MEHVSVGSLLLYFVLCMQFSGVQGLFTWMGVNRGGGPIVMKVVEERKKVLVQDCATLRRNTCSFSGTLAN